MTTARAHRKCACGEPLPYRGGRGRPPSKCEDCKVKDHARRVLRYYHRDRARLKKTTNGTHLSGASRGVPS